MVVPLHNIQELTSATVKDLRELHLSPTRDTVISDSLDVHISVEGLIRDFQRSKVFSRLISTLWAAQGEVPVKRSACRRRETAKKVGGPPKVSIVVASS